MEVARVFRPLLNPSRYKGAYGGRGSGKSHFFAELLIEDCLVQRGMLAVCIREAQRTLAQSPSHARATNAFGVNPTHSP